MAGERLLVADDEPQIVRMCSRTLSELGYEVRGATGGREALACLEAEDRSGAGFDLLLVDIKMPDLDGLTVLRRARELDPNLAVIVITGYGTMENAIDALNAGARKFILKPFGVDELTAAVTEILAERQKEKEWLRMRAQLPILEWGQALVTKGDVQELAKQLLIAVAQQLGAERAALLLLDKGRGVLRPAALAGSWSDPPGDICPGDLPPRAEVSISKGEIRLVLHARGQVVGLLILGGATAATPADLELLVILGAQIAIALENARLFDEVNRVRREWHATFDAITDGISIHDADFRLVQANRTLSQWLGIPAEALVGQFCYTLVHHQEEPIAACPHVRTLASGQPQTVEIEEPVLGGAFQVSTYPLTDEQGQVHGSVHVLRDVTEQKRLQAQLIQSEKLAALGRLAASLAHEINNPLQALRSGLGLLASRSFGEEKRQRYLQVASREVERLINITERMLGFYRPSAEQRVPIDINQVLDDTLVLAGKELQHGQVTVQRKMAPRLPPVKAMSDQLGQVFLNILLNALDAMPNGGELTVETGQNADSREVWAAFGDTGVGIAAQDMAHIFEPLYTTKPRGTGLGLAVSYGIVERHGGRIEVKSRVGEGSRFTVFLPIL